MIPIDQIIFDPKYGDCMRACVASILEVPIESIPNFMEDGPDRFEKAIRDWTKEQDFLLVDTICEKAVESVFPDCYMIAMGKSPNIDGNHAVVYYNGKMVHDPSPYKKGIIGAPILYTIFVMKNPKRRSDGNS